MRKITLAQVRRKDRAVEDEAWIRALLRRAPVAALAAVQDGQPYIHTNLFLFDETEDVIYFHGAQAGRMRESVESNPRICFTVSEMGRLLPAQTSLNMSVEFASVVVSGSARVITDPAQAERALRLIIEKYFSHLEYGKDYRSIQPDELARTAVYCIDIEEWSGKRKQVAEDTPGAFVYGQPT